MGSTQVKARGRADGARCGATLPFATIANGMTAESTQKPDCELDTTGLLCPEPLMIVRNTVRSMAAGEIVRVTATDPSTDRDFRNFCRFMGHEMVHKDLQGEVLEYWIRKGGE